MSQTISHNDVKSMIGAAVVIIKDNHEMLSKLDSATGDGDHGTTMLRTMQAVENTMAENPDESLKELLYKIGWAIMSADGGSTGPLLGSFFMGLSEGLPESAELNGAGVTDMISAGVDKMHKQSRAQIGDKTMMDALLPAQEALKNAGPDMDIVDLLNQAAQAAEAGAKATESMKAKFGRARNLGDRVLGHKDPGAVSISLIFRGFHESLEQH